MATTKASSLQSEQPVLTLKFFLIFVAFPYIIGVYISKYNPDAVEDLMPRILLGGESMGQTAEPKDDSPVKPMENLDKCYGRLMNTMFPVTLASRRDDPFANLSIVLHRNGEPEPCGDTSGANILEELKIILASMEKCPADFDNKYEVEALMTRLLHKLIGSCYSTEKNRSPAQGLFGYCDMGKDKTPILMDHDKLVPIYMREESNGRTTTYRHMPCHFHNHNGVRMTSLEFLAELARISIARPKEQCSAVDGKGCEDEEKSLRELKLYAVPTGRVFMFAASFVGEIIELPHIQGGDPQKPVYLEVMSTNPRVFDLVNFFSREDSAGLVERALQEKSESHRIKRSSTGASGYNVNQRRTSESGYDTSGPTAMRLKRRSFNILGFDEYLESHADGLQILRYNISKAYTPHLDWIDGNDKLEHNFESGEAGGNRFATILLYMTDLGERDGGETVFTEAWPVGTAKEDRIGIDQALRELRESGDANELEQGSWEETLVAKCRSRMAIKPKAGRAILFYSELPNGQPDRQSLHAGCPVLRGTKYAANLWVWNTPRQGYAGNPKRPDFKRTGEESQPEQVPYKVTFTNTETVLAFENAELFFEDQFWGKLGYGDPPLHVNTYDGHVWNVKVEGKTLKTWTIGIDKGTEFSV